MNTPLETSEHDARPYTPPPHIPAPLEDPEAIFHRIEQEVGALHHGWGSVDPHELIRAVLKHASSEASLRQQIVGMMNLGLESEGRIIELEKEVERLTESMSEPRAAEAPGIKQEPFAHFKFEPSTGKYSQMPPAHAGFPGVIAAYANPKELTTEDDGRHTTFAAPIMAAAGMAPVPSIDSIQQALKKPACGWVRGNQVTWDEPPADQLHLYEPVVCSLHVERMCNARRQPEGWLIEHLSGTDELVIFDPQGESLIVNPGLHPMLHKLASALINE